MGQVTVIPHSGPLTRDDLELLRGAEEGSAVRYELLDGSVIVTPSPGRWHQTVAFGLARLLHDAKPENLVVFMAPFDVDLAEDTVLQPDILLAPRKALTDRALIGPPVLAVEVLSPSTRRLDLTLKLDRYREAGCPSYWVVDPLVPSVTVFELDGTAYREVLHAGGQEQITLERPFPLTLRPAALREE